MLEGTDADLWRRGDVVFSLFLDGIDEAVETPERIADILSGLLRTERGDLKKLRLRITGRFATWSESMRRALRSVFASVKEYVIQPLRRTQVEQWLSAHGGGDGVALLRVLVDKGLAPLAARPITLTLLAKYLRATKGAVESLRAADLYRAVLAEGRSSALRLLERAERIERTPHLDQACHQLGAMTVLGDHSDFSLEPPPTGRDREVLNALVERGMDVGLWIDALTLGEFVQVDDRFRWKHASFAEFHAACWVKKQGATAEEKLRWLLGESEGSLDALPPPVESAAAWLAEMDDQVFERLLAEAPLTIARCDRTLLDAGRRARLVEALLARPEAVTFGWSGSWWTLRGLEAPEVDAVLGRSIRDHTQPSLNRHLAMQILSLCKATSLGRLAVEVACDVGEDPALRHRAVSVVREHGDLEARSALRAMPELADSALDDQAISLRYSALSAIWRRSREHNAAATIDEALRWIVSGSDDIVHHCTEFVERRLAPTLRDDELPTAVRWAAAECAAEPGRWSSLARRMFDAVIERAWESATSALTAAALADFFYTAQNDQIFFSAKRSDNQKRPEDAVRAVTLAIVSRSDREDKRIAFRLDRLVALLPWTWCAEQARNDEPHAALWASLAFDQVRGVLEGWSEPMPEQARADHIKTFEDFETERKESEAFRTVSQWYVDGVPLDAEWVRYERQHRTDQRRDAESHAEVTTKLARVVAEHFTLLEEEPTERFWQFAHWCRASASHGDRYDLHHEWQIDETPWWGAATVDDRARVVFAAERYLTLGDSHAGEWFGASKWDYRAEAGVLALLLLEKYAPDTFVQFDAAPWTRWIPALIYFSALDGTAPSVGVKLLPRAARMAPEAFAAWIDREVENEIDAHKDVFVLRRVPVGADVTIARRLLAQHLLARLTTLHHGRALQTLLTYVHDEFPADAEEIALRALNEPCSMGDAAQSRQVGTAAFLLQCGGSRGWDAVWQQVRVVPALGEHLVKQGGWPGERDTFWRLDERPVGALRELWQWLVVRWPYGERGVGIREIITGEEVRNAALSALERRVADPATGEEALRTLRAMSADHPELDWLPRLVASAERAWRARRWRPWPPDRIARGT